jgi:tryptophanyl-tRNA synthetase
MKATAKIYDLQVPTAKMSKTGGTPTGILEVLDEPAVLTKRIRSAVTDSGREVRFDREAKPGVANLLTIAAALSGRSVADLEADYDGRGYGDLKKDVASIVVEALAPVREKVQEYLATPELLDDVLADGAERARVIARATLERVYDRLGLLPPRRPLARGSGARP